MMINKKVRNNKGITLVSLIVTIVVLMIVAVVTISGARDSSIIDKAEVATKQFDETQFLERIELIKFNELAEYKLSPPVDSSGNKLSKQKAVAQAIVNEFEGAFEVNNYIRIPNYPKGIVIDKEINCSVQELDLLDGYRNDQASDSYKMKAVWNKENKNIVNFSHYSKHFDGPSKAYKPFIAQNSNMLGSTTPHAACGGNAGGYIKTIEEGVEYLFTAEVVNINVNEATADNDGNFYIGIVNGAYVYETFGTKTIKLSEIKEGTKIEILFTGKNYYPQCFVFGASVPAEKWAATPKWDFDCEIKVEEVKS